MNLRHLHMLGVINHLGSITAAADAINLTQPAITQALAKLERQIGQPLFERRAEGMEPTPAALVIVPRIKAALDLIASPRVTMVQMRALIMIADHGSYVGASAVTGLAQPSLHRAIADLSFAIKRVLVERRGKGIALTEHGRRTARAFRLARAELEAGLSELSALHGEETGRISVGAMPLSRARLLPAAITAFHRLHPDVRINIVEGAFGDLIEPLRDGEIDIMIGALRDPVPGADVVQRALFEDRPVVMGRVGHPLSHLQPTLTDLGQYPWAIAAPGTPLRIMWEQMFGGVGTSLPPVPIESGSVMIIRQIMMDSDFLTLLSPDQVAVEIEAGWLTKIADTPDSLTRTIGMTVRSGWRPTAMQATFVEMLANTG